jgi:hypothetical protein
MYRSNGRVISIGHDGRPHPGSSVQLAAHSLDAYSTLVVIYVGGLGRGHRGQ